MARYARISIKRHEIKGSKFQFPWSLLLLTLCSLSPVGIYTNRHFCRSRRQRYYLRPASKFGISRLLNILVGILHRETSLSLSLSACLVLPLTCPCWSCVCRSRWFSSRRRAFSLSLSLSLSFLVRLQEVAPTESARRWSLTSHTSCPRRRKRSHAFFPFGRRRLDLCPLANEKNACDVGSTRVGLVREYRRLFRSRIHVFLDWMHRKYRDDHLKPGTVVPELTRRNSSTTSSPLFHSRFIFVSS